MANLGTIFLEYSGVISVIAVAAITGLSEYRLRRDKKIKLLQEENKKLEEDAEKKARQKEKDELIGMIESIKEDHKNEIDSIKDRIQKTEDAQRIILERMDEIKIGLEKVIKITLEDREMIENLNIRFDTEHKAVKAINDKLDEIQSVFERQNEDIQHISSNLHNSIIYTQSVANVVTTLAEALRDNHMNGNISNCVSEFRKKELEVFTAISETNIRDNSNKKVIKKRPSHTATIK